MKITRIEEHQPPFPGQAYHVHQIVDFGKMRDDGSHLPLTTYVDSAYHGGMMTEAFQGIRQGITVRADGTGKKIHDHYFQMDQPVQVQIHAIY